MGHQLIFTDFLCFHLVLMLKFSKGLLYGKALLWKIERDKLDAVFTRIGSGFVTQNTLSEAKEINDRITQILTQTQMILGSGIPECHEPPLLPVREAQKSVPIYAHSKDGGNLW